MRAEFEEPVDTQILRIQVYRATAVFGFFTLVSPFFLFPGFVPLPCATTVVTL